jgi:Pyrimidine dimer DNA glycosylase
MQTFLPYEDFVESLECLDYRRLGKQRVEAMQLLKVINSDDPKIAWRNHPAAKMWRGYSSALTHYMNLAIEEWLHRGYKNTMTIVPIDNIFDFPPWLGNKDFHNSHKSNLLRKQPEYYNKFGWNVPDDLPYVWPV